ncbi:MAG: hypothetical protein WEB06_15365 [Actinomycetota bacterium]
MARQKATTVMSVQGPLGGSSSDSPGRSRRPALRASLAAALLMAALVWSPPAARAADDGVVVVGRLPSSLGATTENTDRQLQIDVPGRRLFEIGQPSIGTTGMRIHAFDLDTLAPAGSLDIPDARPYTKGGGERAVIDELHHRLFVLYAQSAGALDPGVDFLPGGKLILSIAVVDTARMRLVGTRPLTDLLPSPDDASAVSNGSTGVKAIGYDAPEDKLYVVTEESSARTAVIVLDTHLVVLHQLEASRLTEGAASRNWSYPVPQCASVVGTQEQSVVLRSGPSVYIPCRAPKLDPISGKDLRADPSGIARVNIGDASSQTDIGDITVDFIAFGGDLTPGPIAVDPVAERLIFRSDGADISEAGIVIFDARASAFIGRIPTPAVQSIGVDAARGRLYGIVQIDAGTPVTALVASSRGLTIDQGRTYPLKLDSEPDRNDLPRTVVDPHRKRLYWELGGAKGGYAVIEDRTPSPPGDASVDPDGNTIDVAEGPNTDVNFAGGARAYGSRVRWVNGLGGPVRNLDLLLPDLETILAFYASFETRDLQFGRVANATLGNSETSARAIGAEFDPATAAELEEIARNLGLSPSQPPPEGEPSEDTDNVIEQTLGPKDEARCADFSGESAAAKSDNATVACDLKETTVAGSSEYRLRTPVELGNGLVVHVGFARSNVSTVRDAKRGIVSIAEAESRDVLLEIPGVVTVDIGRVYTRAETYSHGRPHTAGSTPFRREISDVVIRTPAGSQQVCSGPCSIPTLATTLNRVLGTRMHVEFPNYDAARAKGSPGGYEALVVRDPFEQVNDQFVNVQGDDAGLEVPGMQLTVFADGRVSSRVVLYLAAVSAESHYGIYRLPSELPLGSTPPVVGIPGVRVPSVVTAPPSGGIVPGPLGELIRRTVRSVTFFLASPGQAARAFLFWGFLASPLLLLRRRRTAGARARFR